MTDFYAEAVELFDYTRGMRRDFHIHPELGFQEVRTAGIVSRELKDLGLEVTTGVGKTGVVAVIEGARPGPVALLRFDMDALPITEETGTEYASQTRGLMHACGHDGHTAVGLTVARLLEAHREELSGTVKLVFQPAEEGLGGAEAMIADGVLDSPRPDLCLALHVWNEKPVGWVGVTNGPSMAASETFKVRITGKGGHGASPHLSVDPILAAAQVITALQSIVSRNAAPLKSAVVSTTLVRAGETFNVIPPYAELQGTIRTFEPEVRAMVLGRFKEIVTGVSDAMGCKSDIDIKMITPAVVNDPQVASVVQDVVSQMFPEGELDLSDRTMGSEDMAYMMQDIPSCYIFVGSNNPAKGLVYGHHHPKFDIDEDVLPRAVALMAASAARFLS